ncbi:hypothetical protein AwDysgo_17720 [Bacteroidales bacterium]|nr:hypothetical protein AwDysgo_17720 [Bacteroidales bacterium]
MNICLAGKNNIAVWALEYMLANYPQNSYFVVCNKNDNGINSWQKSLKYAAIKNNITILDLEQVYELPNLLFLSLEFDRIIRPNKFSTKELFNLHFSLLPAYKGMFTSVMPIINGENIAGISLHKIDAGIDTGHILDQSSFPIAPYDNSRALYDNFLMFGFELFKKNLKSLINNTYTTRVQGAMGASYYSKDTLNFSNLSIDLKKTAQEIHNQVRAFSFRDYQLPQISGKSIYKTEIQDGQSDKLLVGRVYDISDGIMEIHAIDYIVHAYIDFEDTLFEAARHGSVCDIQRISDLEYDIFIKNKRGWNLLIVAVFNEHLDLVQYLLDKGFDVNSQNYTGTSVLMYAMTAASISERTDILDLIIQYNPNFYLTDDKDLGVLAYAHQYKNTKIINYIQSSYDKVSRSSQA